jgi:hypothetical protein
MPQGARNVPETRFLKETGFLAQSFTLNLQQFLNPFFCQI